MSFRPETLDEIIGLDNVKVSLRYDIEGAKIRGAKFPNYILTGPPGVGKTTISHIISRMLGGSIHRYLGTSLRTAEHIHELAQTVKDNDIVFVEEAHGIGQKASDVLLPWLEEGKLFGSGNSDTAPKVVFLFPTTNSGMLTDALRNRCKAINLHYYTPEEIEKMILQALNKMTVKNFDEEAVSFLARSSRGTPRIAIEQRLEPCLNIAAVERTDLNTSIVQKLFEINQIHPEGLSLDDINYCRTLANLSPYGAPVAFKTICQALGLAEDVVQNVIESYLIQAGLIRILPRGRVLSEYGYRVLGINKERNDMSQLSSKVPVVDVLASIDREDLKNRLANGEIKSTKQAAEIYGFKYVPAETSKFRVILNELGYDSRRKVGIVRVK